MSDYSSSLGFIQFWGHSKQLNLVTPQMSGTINILLSGVSDLRHFLETCLCNHNRDDLQLNFYIHEKYKETVCRSLLLLLIMHTKNFTYRERSDMFLEVFGNTFLRESTTNYIDKVIPFLDDLIAKETKFTSALNQIVDFRELKFKDRDEMTEVIRSWYSYQEFKIEKLRDQRLRHHYGIRFDHRLNMIDWDYQMNLKDFAPIIHFIHYREWRQSGVAFESRYASYPTPNRTLAGYLPGKHKQTKDSLLVRGYWGDIVVSPYISFGIYTSVQPENEQLFKVRNTQQVSHAVTVSEFNIQHMIQKFDNGTDYHIHVDEYLERQDNKQKQKEEKQKEEGLEKIDEKEEENEQQEQEQQQQQQQQDQQKQEQQDQQQQDQQQEQQQEQYQEQQDKQEDTNISELNTTITDTSIKQVITKDNMIVEIQQDPLQTFQKLKVKIIPIFEEFDKLCGKKKYQNFFDVGVLGFMESIKVKDPKLRELFKKQSKLFVESTQFIVPFTKEERIKGNENVQKISVSDGGWTLSIVLAQTENSKAQKENSGAHSQQEEEGPSQSLVYGVVVILLGALGYFIYNFYVCHKKKIDYGLDGDEEHHYEIEIQKRKDNL
ncbi:unnamed protein product [Paramecium pentaurelia]|uniref:Uncharacterized protein n=1 Tax=Paramecium pentaurelia TaxID=43138 RepID=A0A8S1YNG5_9CILI|nr:unnamed protein product [Paramecium pentaurelia]